MGCDSFLKSLSGQHKILKNTFDSAPPPQSTQVIKYDWPLKPGTDYYYGNIPLPIRFIASCYVLWEFSTKSPYCIVCIIIVNQCVYGRINQSINQTVRQLTLARCRRPLEARVVSSRWFVNRKHCRTISFFGSFSDEVNEPSRPRPPFGFSCCTCNSVPEVRNIIIDKMVTKSIQHKSTWTFDRILAGIMDVLISCTSTPMKKSPQ